jgi:hypothetical protein
MGEVRDLGFVSWNDEFADIEDMSSTAFKKACSSENTIYKKTLSELKEKNKQEWINIYKSIKNKHEFYYAYKWNKYTISVSGRSTYIDISGNGKHIKLSELRCYGITKNLIWIIKDDTEGKRKNVEHDFIEAHDKYHKKDTKGAVSSIHNALTKIVEHLESIKPHTDTLTTATASTTITSFNTIIIILLPLR